MEKRLDYIIYFKHSFNLYFSLFYFFPFTVEVYQIFMLTTTKTGKKKSVPIRMTRYKTCQQRPVLPTFQQAQWGRMIIGADKLCHSNKRLKYKTEITVWSSRHIFFFFNLQSFGGFLHENFSFPLKQVMCLEAEVVIFLVMLAKRNYHFVVSQYNNSKKGALNKWFCFRLCYSYAVPIVLCSFL